jgi:hypothetical protein
MRILVLHILFFISLAGCTKGDVAEQKDNAKSKLNDLIFASEKDNSLGYYKSSLIKNDGKISVWVHLPNSNIDSKKDIEKVSDLQIEIVCGTREYRLLNAADEKGKRIDFVDDEKWDSPSPKNRFYTIILKVCSEAH